MRSGFYYYVVYYYVAYLLCRPYYYAAPSGAWMNSGDRFFITMPLAGLWDYGFY
jgi:hypothetical protein